MFCILALEDVKLVNTLLTALRSLALLSYTSTPATCRSNRQLVALVFDLSPKFSFFQLVERTVHLVAVNMLLQQAQTASVG